MELDALAAGGTENAASRIAALRGHIAEMLEFCKGLAVGLRPPLLDQLGLVPALERLAQRAGSETDVDAALADVELCPALKTDVYRAVDEALTVMTGERHLTVWLDPGAREICAAVRALDADVPIGEPGRLEARLELIGGALTLDRRELHVRIPVVGAIVAFPQPQHVEIPDGERRGLSVASSTQVETRRPQ